MTRASGQNISESCFPSSRYKGSPLLPSFWSLLRAAVSNQGLCTVYAHVQCNNQVDACVCIRVHAHVQLLIDSTSSAGIMRSPALLELHDSTEEGRAGHTKLLKAPLGTCKDSHQNTVLLHTCNPYRSLLIIVAQNVPAYCTLKLSQVILIMLL